MRLAITLCLTLVPQSLAAQDLKALFDGRRWLELRDALSRTDAPFLYRGAIASAFNRPQEAERLLLAVARQSPDSEDAFEAHKFLVDVYWRAGRFSELLPHIKEMLRLKPDYPGGRNTLAALGAFERDGEQTVARRRVSRLRYKMTGGNLTIPISINGKPRTIF